MTESKFIPEIELDVTKLPSRGLSYPTGTKIKYRTYTFGEVRKISTSNMSIESSLKMAIEGIETDFGAKNLTLMDALYIGILRKISSLTEMKFEVPYMCTKCKKAAKGVFNHNDITFRDIDKDVSSLPIYIDLGGKELAFSPMTVSDYFELTSGKHDDVFKDSKIDRVAVQAISIKNMSFKAAYEMLYKVNTPEDIELITEVDRLLLHDIENLKTTCRNNVEGKTCGGENSIKLEGREALISPFRSSEGTVRNRIRFSSTPKPQSISD